MPWCLGQESSGISILFLDSLIGRFYAQSEQQKVRFRKGSQVTVLSQRMSGDLLHAKPNEDSLAGSTSPNAVKRRLQRMPDGLGSEERAGRFLFRRTLTFSFSPSLIIYFSYTIPPYALLLLSLHSYIFLSSTISHFFSLLSGSPSYGL